MRRRGGGAACDDERNGWVDCLGAKGPPRHGDDRGWHDGGDEDQHSRAGAEVRVAAPHYVSIQHIFLYFNGMVQTRGAAARRESPSAKPKATKSRGGAKANAASSTSGNNSSNSNYVPSESGNSSSSNNSNLSPNKSSTWRGTLKRGAGVAAGLVGLMGLAGAGLMKRQHSALQSSAVARPAAKPRATALAYWTPRPARPSASASRQESRALVALPAARQPRDAKRRAPAMLALPAARPPAPRPPALLLALSSATPRSIRLQHPPALLALPPSKTGYDGNTNANGAAAARRERLSKVELRRRLGALSVASTKKNARRNMRRRYSSFFAAGAALAGLVSMASAAVRKRKPRDVGLSRRLAQTIAAGDSLLTKSASISSPRVAREVEMISNALYDVHDASLPFLANVPAALAAGLLPSNQNARVLDEQLEKLDDSLRELQDLQGMMNELLEEETRGRAAASPPSSTSSPSSSSSDNNGLSSLLPRGMPGIFVHPKGAAVARHFTHDRRNRVH